MIREAARTGQMCGRFQSLANGIFSPLFLFFWKRHLMVTVDIRDRSVVDVMERR